MTEDLNRSRAEVAYQALLQRSLAEHSEMWQTPSLALAAEAFLLTIALDPQSVRWAAAPAAALATLVAAMSMQLMAVRRFNNNVDRRR